MLDVGGLSQTPGERVLPAAVSEDEDSKGHGKIKSVANQSPDSVALPPSNGSRALGARRASWTDGGMFNP